MIAHVVLTVNRAELLRTGLPAKQYGVLQYTVPRSLGIVRLRLHGGGLAALMPR